MANWTIEERRQIWNKGQVVPGYDPTMWSKDQCGAFIKWDKYGDRSDRYNNGWEIDHIKPDSFGGPDTISNARRVCHKSVTHPFLFFSFSQIRNL